MTTESSPGKPKWYHANDGSPVESPPDKPTPLEFAGQDETSEPEGAIAEEFAVGDVVALKSGGPNMTIVAVVIGAARGLLAETKRFYGNVLAVERWPLECLRLVPPPDIS